MRALVTGACGFIGSHLVDRLIEDGHDVTAVDSMRSAAVDDLPAGVALHRVSVADAGLDRFPANVIYHLAGPVGPVGVLSQAGHIVEDVIRDARIVRDAALHRRSTLVYVSTSETYGPQPAGPIPEVAPRVIAAGHTARMEYAVAKLAAETMLLNTPNLDLRIIRPFNVAGPRQRPEGGFVLPRFIGQARDGRPLTVYTPGTQRRAFTHVLDIVDGIVRAAERGWPCDVYNLGNPDNECDITTLAHEVIDVLGSSSGISVVDPVDLWGTSFAEAPDKVPDTGHAFRVLGWVPTRSRRQVIADAAA